MTNPPPTLTSASNELALLVEEVQDYAIFLLSPTGEIRSWNRGAARIMGYSADEIIGSSFSRFYTDEDLRNEKPLRELVTATNEGRVEDEGWRIRKDGQRFWANTIITALRDDGQLIGFAKITRDLTERRAADERLRQSEELFRLLVGSVKEYAIFMLDPEGNIASWNEGAHRIKGYEASEIIGRHFSNFYPEEDIRAGKPARELEVAKEQGSIEDEGWRLRKDGTRFWANVVITAVFDETGVLRGFAKVTRDMTERRQADEVRRTLLEQREARLQAEEERRRAEESFRVSQEANRAKDEFLMTLSHEMRTPMTAILGWARLLPSLKPGDAVFSEAVAAIGRSAQLQARLIDDVLDVSRIISGKLRLARETFDIAQLLRAAIEAVQPMADARRVVLRNLVAPDLGELLADPTRIQQIVWNLLTNAVKFTPKGGSVELRARRTSSHVQIEVCDTGEGIEANFLAHVFEPFRQAESPRTRVHGGLGLGLSIVRYLVEAHGGTVSAESAGRGHGATFTVTFPVSGILSKPLPESGTSERDSAVSVAGRLANRRILIVDDDRETRDLVRAVLRQAGAKVTAVESGPAALDHFDRDHPDIILTDVAMPGMDGYEFARNVRKRPGSTAVKIIALTAFPAGTQAAEVSGFDDYLTKPMEPSDLVEAIVRVDARPR
jgi:hypothetical protein